MKKVYGFMVAVILFFGSVVMAYAIHELIPSETQIVMPGPNAEKLYEYIVRYKPYTDWELWPKKGKFYEGTEPHGALLTTFVNDAAFHSIFEKKGMYDGSIIVKENYTADKKLIALTVMYKIQGYNPDAGDWFWAKYSPDGKTVASGKVKACIDCHGKMKDKDYIFTGKVK